ncbi:MAG: helix-turn-helix transcriptional regulator [Desulfosporosinus sp.]
MDKITLKAAREMAGYTVEEAAKWCDVSIAQMETYENKPGEIPKTIACKIKRLYNILLESLEIK